MKDDMDAENGKDVKEEGGLQEEIVHWRKMAETLEYQLSTTIQDLDKRVNKNWHSVLSTLSFLLCPFYFVLSTVYCIVNLMVVHR